MPGRGKGGQEKPLLRDWGLRLRFEVAFNFFENFLYTHSNSLIIFLETSISGYER